MEALGLAGSMPPLDASGRDAHGFTELHWVPQLFRASGPHDRLR
jgi:hypothetical protein